MKKLIFILITTSINITIFAQSTPKFILTKDGVSPVVLNFDLTLKSDEIYKRIKDWYHNVYKNPQSGIRIDTENKLLKIGAFKEKAWKIRDNNFDHWYDLEYTLNIEIKDAKCRVTFGTPEVRYKVWFNKDGSTIPKFKDSKSTFESTINDPLTSLYKYIKEPVKVVKDEW